MTPTPDDGVRLAAEPLRDESQRPHWPRAVAGTEYSPLGRGLAGSWRRCAITCAAS